ncbi:MAG TPA: sodium:solute symporter, partial [Phycisphaerae bacterium]|nr:sodium:solute symporter [Phycisphaerae bacterium]
STAIMPESVFNLRLLIDAIVLLAYFFGIVAIGLWAGRRNKNLRDFALGGRSIPWWAVLASIIAAETSAATFLGTPAEGFKTRAYFYGQLVIGTILARIVIAFTFIKPYYDYRVQSVYEFLTVRFGTKTKNMASGIFLFTRVLGIGVRLYLGGAIMVVIWRYLFPSLPVNLNTYIWGIIFVTVITTIYTAVGGIKAVVWTDLIQAILMFSSVIFAIFLLLHNIPGGFETVKENLGGLDKIKFFQTGWNAELPFGAAMKAMMEEPYTLFAAFIGSTLLTMATHGTDQDMVQRMLTAPDHRKSQLSLILSGIMDVPIALAFLTVGILLSVYYSVVPGVSLPAADNEIFGHYIVHEMPVVFRGLIIAGVFATMMGSTSAALNALATSFTKDFYLPYIRPDANDRQAIRAARIATAVFGILMIIVAAVAANAVLHNAKLTIIPIAIGILGYTYGALLAVFLLGMLTRTRGADGANVLAMTIGITSVLILCKVTIPAFDVLALFTGKIVAVQWVFGYFMPEWWPKISWPWFVFVGCIVTLAISVLFRTPKSQILAAEEHVRHVPEPARTTN